VKRVRRLLVLAGAGVLLLATLGWALVRWPRPWFRFSARLGSLALYSDRPFDPAAATAVLERVAASLGGSPLYSSARPQAIYVCNANWRRRFFMAPHPGAGGLNYSPWTTNVFFSGADLAANRLVSPTRQPDLFGRTLDHFVAHEIAHTLEARAVGALAYWRMPDWVTEGYAEYIGGGGRLDYVAAARAYLANDPEMNRPAAVPYLRYRFLVTHLIEKRGWSHSELLATALDRNEADQLVARDLTDAGAQRRDR
jgi:hypothetical protein